MNKKGIFFDLFTIIFLLGLLPVVLLFVSKLLGDFASQAEASGMSEEAVNGLVNGQTAVNWIDYVLIFILVALIIVGIIVSSTIQVHPAYIIFGVVFLVIGVITAGVFSNFSQQFFNSTTFETEADTMTVGDTFTGNLPTITLICGGVFLVFLYAKSMNG